MTALELALANLAAWSLQTAVLATAAAGLARVVPVEQPRVRLALGQSLLALALALPFVQPWRVSSAAVSWSLSLAPKGGERAGLAPTPLPAAATDAWCVALGLLLALGAAYRLARLAAALLELRALGRGAVPFDPPPWLAELRDEVAPRARFAVLEGAGAPATFGLRRPLILLPPAFAASPRERQAAMALHELLHVRRGDWLAQLAEELALAACFFHPALHWLVARVRLAREQVVDAAVVRRLGDREAYLESLVEAARSAALVRAVPAAPFFRESHLRERVELLLKEACMSEGRALRNAALTSVVLLLTLALTAVAMPLQSSAPATGTAGGLPAVKAPYEPKKTHHVSPAYPQEAKTDKAQGVFQIEIVVGKDGVIREARVVASAPTLDRIKELDASRGTPAALEGDSRLAEAALVAVKQWRYEPVLIAGAAVDVKMTVTVNFRLS